MLGRKKKTLTKLEYDRENHRPILRCSICTGEQVAGFKNIHTGFEEVVSEVGVDTLREEYCENGYEGLWKAERERASCPLKRFLLPVPRFPRPICRC